MTDYQAVRLGVLQAAGAAIVGLVVYATLILCNSTECTVHYEDDGAGYVTCQVKIDQRQVEY